MEILNKYLFIWKSGELKKDLGQVYQLALENGGALNAMLKTH